MELIDTLDLRAKNKAFDAAVVAFLSLSAPLIITGKKGTGRLALSFSAALAWAAESKVDRPRKRLPQVCLIANNARDNQTNEIQKISHEHADALTLKRLSTSTAEEWAKVAKMSQKNSPDLYLLDDVDSHEQADAAVDLIKNGCKVIVVTTGRLGDGKSDNIADMLLRMLASRFPTTSIPVFDTSGNI